MENLTYEEKLQALELELIDSKTNVELNQKAANEIHLENLIMYGMYFQNHGVNFQLQNIRRSRTKYDDDGEFEFSLYFSTEENRNWNQITVEIIFNSKNNTGIVNRLSFPSKSVSGNEINLEKSISYHENVKNLLVVLNNMDQLIPYLQNYKTLENQIKTRSEYEIRNDIDNVKESIRIRNMNFRVGTTLMVNTTGGSRRYRYPYWSKVTIVKINKKTVYYVIQYEDGKVSELQSIHFDYRYFMSIGQYETEKKELEEKLNKSC
jgi:hypothetical protein